MGTSDYEDMNVEQLYEMVNVDNLEKMKEQVQGWYDTRDLFQTEIDALKADMASAKETWSGEAANRYFLEIENTIKSMENAKDTANGNGMAWSSIQGYAQSTRTEINDEYTKWLDAKGKLDEEKASDDGFQGADLLDPIGQGNNVTSEDYDEKRKPFDQAARRIANNYGEKMQDEYYKNIWNPKTQSDYKAPPDPGEAPDWPEDPYAPGPGGGGPDYSGGSNVPGGNYGTPSAPPPPGGYTDAPPRTEPGPGGPILQTPPPPPVQPPPTQPPPPVQPPPTQPPPPVQPPPVTRPPVPPPTGKPPVIKPPPTGKPPVTRPPGTPPPPTTRPPMGKPPTGGPPGPRPPGRTVPPVIRGPQGPGTGPTNRGPIANPQRPAPTVRPVTPQVIGQRGPTGPTTSTPGVRNPTAKPPMTPGKAGMDTRGVFGTRASKLGGSSATGSPSAAGRTAGVRSAPVGRTGAEGLNRGVIRGAKGQAASSPVAGGARGTVRKRDDERSTTIDSDGPLDDVFNVDKTVVPGVIRGWTPPDDTDHSAGPAMFGERPGKAADKRKKKIEDEWDDW